MHTTPALIALTANIGQATTRSYLGALLADEATPRRANELPARAMTMSGLHLS